ncbi:MAG: hypothetical protein AAFX02_07910 [Pseudomonadota bacterium]
MTDKTSSNAPDELDDLLADMAEVEIPLGLAERILADAPDHKLGMTERPQFWDRFFKPIIAGPGLAAALFVGISVGYASADSTAYDDADFSYAFEDSSLWLEDFSEEEAL